MARWAISLHAGGGVGELRRFVLYLMATKGQEAIEAFEGALRCHGLEQGGEIVTYAQDCWQKVERKAGSKVG